MESLCKRSTSCQLWEVLAKCFDNKGWVERVASQICSLYCGRVWGSVCVSAFKNIYTRQYVYHHPSSTSPVLAPAPLAQKPRDVKINENKYYRYPIPFC